MLQYSTYRITSRYFVAWDACRPAIIRYCLETKEVVELPTDAFRSDELKPFISMVRVTSLSYDEETNVVVCAIGIEGPSLAEMMKQGNMAMPVTYRLVDDKDVNAVTDAMLEGPYKRKTYKSFIYWFDVNNKLEKLVPTPESGGFLAQTIHKAYAPKIVAIAVDPRRNLIAYADDNRCLKIISIVTGVVEISIDDGEGASQESIKMMLGGLSEQDEEVKFQLLYTSLIFGAGDILYIGNSLGNVACYDVAKKQYLPQNMKCSQFPIELILINYSIDIEDYGPTLRYSSAQFTTLTCVSKTGPAIWRKKNSDSYFFLCSYSSIGLYAMRARFKNAFMSGDEIKSQEKQKLLVQIGGSDVNSITKHGSNDGKLLLNCQYLVAQVRPAQVILPFFSLEANYHLTYDNWIFAIVKEDLKDRAIGYHLAVIVEGLNAFAEYFTIKMHLVEDQFNGKARILIDIKEFKENEDVSIRHAKMKDLLFEKHARILC
jgi:hypothetical protein